MSINYILYINYIYIYIKIYNLYKYYSFKKYIQKYMTIYIVKIFNKFFLIKRNDTEGTSIKSDTLNFLKMENIQDNHFFFFYSDKFIYIYIYI